MFGKKTPKPPKVRLSDLCHTSQADMERIINQAPIPPGNPPGTVRVNGRAQRKSRRG